MMSRALAGAVVAALLAVGCSDSITEVNEPEVSAPQAVVIPELPPVLGTNAGYQVQGKVEIAAYPGVANDVYQFAAKEFKGKVTGNFTYDTQLITGAAHVEGDVVCFMVVEEQITVGATVLTVARARLAGVVTETNTPLMPLGHVLIWNVSDNNKTSNTPDSGSPLLGYPFSPALHCTAGGFYPEFPTLSGFVHISQVSH